MIHRIILLAIALMAGCTNSTAPPYCPDECPPGASQCRGLDIQSCVFDEHRGCFLWAGQEHCPEGQACLEGSCREVACQSECVAGERECLGANFRVCLQGADGCTTWGSITACAWGETCSAGYCGGGCAGECLLGQSRCQEGGVQLCEDIDGTLCPRWATITPCSEGLTCQDGFCTRLCTDLCAAGETACIASSLATCLDSDGDGCLDWGTTEDCPFGQSCSNGVCGLGCDDECGLGDIRCLGPQLQPCGDHDPDACLDWGPVESCPAGLTCIDSSCSGQCQDLCVAGQSRCSGTDIQLCQSADGCLDWGPVTPCSGGEACQDNVCVGSCADECDEGQARCSGVNIQYCGDSNGDGCLDWGGDFPCPEGEACEGDVCTGSCSDQCTTGQSRCLDRGMQYCGDSNGDGCLDWGTTLACPQGQVCQGGACQVPCSDECLAGQSRCLGTDIESCGDSDGDGCLDWGAAMACPQGQGCYGDVCVTLGDCALGNPANLDFTYSPSPPVPGQGFIIYIYGQGEWAYTELDVKGPSNHHISGVYGDVLTCNSGGNCGTHTSGHRWAFQVPALTQGSYCIIFNENHTSPVSTTMLTVGQASGDPCVPLPVGCECPEACQNGACDNGLCSSDPCVPLPVGCECPEACQNGACNNSLCEPVGSCDPLGESYIAIGVDGRLGHPSDPAGDANINIKHRGRVAVNEARELVDYGGDTDTMAPKLYTLFQDDAYPGFGTLYKVGVYDGIDHGTEGTWPVHMAGLLTRPCETIEAPCHGYDIGDGCSVMVLYADADSVALKVGREDSIVEGYTVHILNIQVSEDLLSLYRSLDGAGRGQLPGVRCNQPIGRALGGEIDVSIRDTGSFMDPRAQKDWW